MSHHPHLQKGLQLLQSGRAREAEAQFRRALEDLPEDPNAMHLLGIACGAQDRHAEAADHFRRAVALLPGASAFHFNLGRALQACGRREEAVAALSEALRLDPRLDEARTRLRDLGAAEAAPDPAREAFRLAEALLAQGRVDEAIPHYHRHLQAHPRDAEGWTRLGNALASAGRPRACVDALGRALELDPAQPRARSTRLANLLYLDGLDPERLAAEHREFGRRHGQARPRPFGSRDWDPERRLKVGYLSPDLRTHSVAFFLEPLLAGHDRALVEVHAFSDVLIPDETTRRLRGLVDAWHGVRDLADEALAERIRDEGIDVLVELAGHTSGNRLPMLPLRPAPVQLSWNGYPGTTGLDCLEGRIVDLVIEPEGSDRFSSEPLLRLDGSWLCARPPAEAPMVALLPARQAGHVTFGSFNNAAKLSPRTLELWAAVLRRVPGSRLLLKSSMDLHGASMEAFREAFAEEGVDPSRIQVLPRAATREAHFAAYGRVDLALDPLNFNGITTSFEGLWMGVPVVTLPGGHPASRCGASLMTQIGLPSFIAGTPAEYVDIATRAAADLPALATLRAGLRARMESSSLCDTTGFARRMEAAYRQAWRQRCTRAREA